LPETTSSQSLTFDVILAVLQGIREEIGDNLELLHKLLGKARLHRTRFVNRSLHMSIVPAMLHPTAAAATWFEMSSSLSDLSVVSSYMTEDNTIVSMHKPKDILAPTLATYALLGMTFG
jgi:hypothetical protein